MAKLAIKKASTSVSLYLFISDSSLTTGAGKTGLAYNTASLVAYYVRPLGSATSITLATQTVTGAWSSGGFVEVDATNMPGVYRFDVPDAVLATGVNSVVVMLKGASNMAPVVLEIDLVAYDPQDTVRLGLTALPNVASGNAGAIITSGTGTAQLSVSGGRANADLTHIATVAVNTSTAQLGVNVVNFGGSAGTFASGRPEVNTTHAAGTSVQASGGYFLTHDILNVTTIASLSSQTSFTLTAGSADNNAYVGCELFCLDQSTAVQKCVGVVSAYTGSTKTITLRTDPGVFTMATGDTIVIRASRSLQPTVDNRTLDVSSGGEAGVDWANVGSPTTTVGLSGTTIATSQVVASVSGAVGSVTGAVGSVTGNVGGNVTGSVGSVASGGITASSLAADCITAAKIADGAIDAATFAAGAINAAAIAADAITDAKVASDVTIASVTGAVGSVTGNVGGNVTGSVGSVASGGITSGSFAAGAINAAAIATDAIGAAELAADAVAEIADQVWDEVLSGHAGVGSAGAALAAAGGSGDPWSTALPGAYSSGTAGYIMGTNLNATVSSRATQTSVDTIDDFVDTEIAAIKAKTDNLPSDPADASDIAASFSTVNSTLATIAGYIDTEVTTIVSNVASILAAVDTEVAAIKAKTDNLPASPAAVSDIPTVAQNVAGVFAKLIETGFTFEQTMKIIAAAAAGKLSGAQTATETFRSLDDSANRIVATVDASGNRSAITYNP